MRHLLEALDFAAQKHRNDRRKGAEPPAPYINHSIEVARLLAAIGAVEDAATLQAAALHDTIEDTATTAAELERVFGAEVRALVEELTDDQSLDKAERKRLQVLHAPALSDRAKCIKIADKISNIREVAYSPPPNWSLERRSAYLDWSEEVVAGCRGVCLPLERHYDDVLRECRARLKEDGESTRRRG